MPTAEPVMLKRAKIRASVAERGGYFSSCSPGAIAATRFSRFRPLTGANITESSISRECLIFAFAFEQRDAAGMILAPRRREESTYGPAIIIRAIA